MVDSLTADAIASSSAFQTRVQAALVRLGKSSLGGNNKRLAGVLLQRNQIQTVTHRMAVELASDGINFASTDAEIDAELVKPDNIRLLRASLGAPDEER